MPSATVRNSAPSGQLVGNWMRMRAACSSKVASDSRINQPEIRDRLGPVATLGERLAQSAETVPSAEVLDQLLSLRTIVERHVLGDIDFDSDEPKAEKLRAGDGLGYMMLLIEKTIAAAKRAGFAASPENGGRQTFEAIPRSKIGESGIDEIVRRVDRIQESVEVLRNSAKAELPAAELPRELVENLANRVETSVGLVRLELSQDDNINVEAVRRDIRLIERLSVAFAATAVRMREFFAPRLLVAAESLTQSATAAVGTVRRVIGKLWGGEMVAAGSEGGPAMSARPGSFATRPFSRFRRRPADDRGAGRGIHDGLARRRGLRRRASPAQR